jgi:hypothetical protein
MKFGVLDPSSTIINSIWGDLPFLWQSSLICASRHATLTMKFKIRKSLRNLERRRFLIKKIEKQAENRLKISGVLSTPRRPGIPRVYACLESCLPFDTITIFRSSEVEEVILKNFDSWMMLFGGLHAWSSLLETKIRRRKEGFGS